MLAEVGAGAGIAIVAGCGEHLVDATVGRAAALSCTGVVIVTDDVVAGGARASSAKVTVSAGIAVIARSHIVGMETARI